MKYREWEITHQQEIAEWEIDEPTKQAISDTFAYRDINSLERFAHYMKVTIARYYQKYLDFIRVETTEIDPLVSEYLERQVLFTRTEDKTKTGTATDRHESENTGTITNAQSGTDTTSNTIEDTVNNEVNQTDTLTHNTTSLTETSDATTETTSGDSSTIAKGANRTSPQSVEMSAGASAKLPNLNFNYATGIQQADTDVETTAETTRQENGTNQTHNTGTDTTVREGTDDTTENATSTGSVTYGKQNLETRNLAGNETGTHTANDSENIDEEHNRRERYTGRHSVLPQDALTKAVNYLTSVSPSFVWFKEKLEINFICVLDDFD